MLRIFLGMSVIVGILAFSACSTSNTTDVIQPVKTANVADNPARENVPAKEVVVEEPAPVKDLSQDTKPPSPLQIGGLVGNEAPEFRGTKVSRHQNFRIRKFLPHPAAAAI